MMIVFLVFGLLLAIAIVRMARRPRIGTFFAIILLVGLIMVFLGPLTGRIDVARWSSAMQTCRTIALAEFQYANDNGGNYPDGKSSTEVFQKLLDGNYVTDPMIFYLSMPGKTPPVASHLKPENVSYDVTSGVSGSIPDGLPLIFITGCKIDYRDGGKATPLSGPHEGIFAHERTWWEWLNFKPSRLSVLPMWRQGSETVGIFAADGDVNSSTPQDFNTHGQTYRQLTPDGLLK